MQYGTYRGSVKHRGFRVSRSLSRKGLLYVMILFTTCILVQLSINIRGMLPSSQTLLWAHFLLVDWDRGFAKSIMRASICDVVAYETKHMVRYCLCNRTRWMNVNLLLCRHASFLVYTWK